MLAEPSLPRGSQEEAIQAEMMAALEPGSGKSDAEVRVCVCECVCAYARAGCAYASNGARQFKCRLACELLCV